MKIGVPREIKKDEYRVAMLPVGVQLLTQDGHTVLIEKDAGLGSGFSNEEYRQAGAQIVDAAADIYDRADMVVKVKEPAARRNRPAAPRPDCFLLFPFRRVARADVPMSGTRNFRGGLRNADG